MASLGTRKGNGNDWMQLSVDSEDFNGEPRHDAGVSIHIPGDTSLTVPWNPNYMVEKPEAYPFDKSVFKSGLGQFAEVRKKVGGSQDNLAQGQ